MNPLKLLAGLPLAALLAVTAGLGTPAPAAAGPKSDITINLPPSARAGDTIHVHGRLTYRPGVPAGTPVVIFIRPFGKSDVNVGTARTDASGYYSIHVRVPANATKNIQVSAVSGGGVVPSDRAAKIIPLK